MAATERSNRQTAYSDAPSGKTERKAFTLIEVLVVVAIIALLVAILLPSLTRARAQAKAVQCGSNVHQQCVTLFLYAADYKGTLPPNPTQGDVRLAPGARPAFSYVNAVVSARTNYDQRKLFRKYCAKNMNIFTCPANGGPNIDSPIVQQVASDPNLWAMLGHYDHFYNSTCVFKETSLDRPWAPKTEWTEAGPPAGVAIIQDEYSAGDPTGKLTDHDTTTYDYNHGPGQSRSSMGSRYTEFGNWPQSKARGNCMGGNIGYLDGHAMWIKNMPLGGTRSWTLDMPWSQASTRPLDNPGENPLQGGVQSSLFRDD